MERTAYWGESSTETINDRRREKRVPLAFPVEVSGFNAEGYFFRELSMTSDVSQSGCRFHLCQNLEKNGVVGIRVSRRPEGMVRVEPTHLFRVAWAKPRDGGYVAGAAKLQGENIWNMKFPSDTDTDFV